MPGRRSHRGLTDRVRKACRPSITHAQAGAGVGGDVLRANESFEPILVVGKNRHNLVDRLVVIVVTDGKVYTEAMGAMVSSGSG
jgi:hypothetical protein